MCTSDYAAELLSVLKSLSAVSLSPEEEVFLAEAVMGCLALGAQGPVVERALLACLERLEHVPLRVLFFRYSA